MPLRILTLLTLLCASIVHCAEPPTVEARALTAPIEVDGMLAEAAWQEGDWSTGFSVLDNPTKVARYQTRFKVRFDDANLYLGAVLDEPNVAAIKAAATERDGHVYSDDCFEVMVDPTGQRIEYYHFIVNSRGVVYDAEMRQGGNVRSEEWNCDLSAAAQVGEASWSVELRLPLVELGLTAASRGDWALNVARERQGDEEELSSFVPTTGGFHQPSLYAALKLPGADFSRFLWEIRPPYEVRVEPDEHGVALLLHAKTHITNCGDKFRFILLRGALTGTEGEWVKDGLDAGQGREYEFSVPVSTQGPQKLRLQLADRTEPEMLLALRSFDANPSYSPITIDVLRPWYRDSIYATESLPALVADVSLSVPEPELPELSMRAMLQDPAGGTVGQKTEPAVRELRLTLPLPGDMAVGDYKLAVVLLKGEFEAYRAEKTIHKLPPVAEEWRIDEANVLRHNGEPVLPFGWFSIPASEMAKPGHAYRLMQSYSSYWFPVDKVRADLDAVVAAGSHVTIYPYPSPKMVETPAWGKPLTDEEAEALRQRVRALKDHPGVFAWYMADEPELRPALPDRCRQMREVLAAEDPFHPTIMLNDTIAGIYKYVDGGDILMPDPYPCFIKGGLAARPMEKTSEFMKACGDASRGRRAIWVTPQAFNYGDYGRQNQRGPTLTELRNQLYQVVIYGAKGFLWYTYGQIHNYPDLGVGMPWLSYEVADLKSAILADPAQDVKVAVQAPLSQHIHVSTRRVAEDLYIFAVNTATEPQDVKLTVTPGIPSLHVVSEQRSVPLADGKVIADHFGIYETHIYTTDAKAGGRTDIKLAITTIQEQIAALKKPGNLAYEDSGATVQVSSESTYGSTPDRVLDGVTSAMMWQDGTPDKQPDWITVRWPQPQTVGKVVIYTPSIASLEVQVPEGEDFKTVATAADCQDAVIEVAIAPAVQTDALRILVTGLRPEHKYSEVWEVEAYAQ